VLGRKCNPQLNHASLGTLGGTTLPGRCAGLSCTEGVKWRHGLFGTAARGSAALRSSAALPAFRPPTRVVRNSSARCLCGSVALRRTIGRSPAKGRGQDAPVDEEATDGGQGEPRSAARRERAAAHGRPTLDIRFWAAR